MKDKSLDHMYIRKDKIWLFMVGSGSYFHNFGSGTVLSQPESETLVLYIRRDVHCCTFPFRSNNIIQTEKLRRPGKNFHNLLCVESLFQLKTLILFFIYKKTKTFTCTSSFDQLFLLSFAF